MFAFTLPEFQNCFPFCLFPPFSSLFLPFPVIWWVGERKEGRTYSQTRTRADILLYCYIRFFFFCQISINYEKYVHLTMGGGGNNINFTSDKTTFFCRASFVILNSGQSSIFRQNICFAERQIINISIFVSRKGLVCEVEEVERGAVKLSILCLLLFLYTILILLYQLIFLYFLFM